MVTFRRAARLPLLLWTMVLLAEEPGWTPAFSMRFRDVGAVQLSSDGKLVAWTEREAVMTESKSEYLTHIFLARADGSGRLQLTRGEKSATLPRFSPDGRFVYFASERSGSNNVYRIPVNGGEAERLTDWQGTLTAYAVSPDGTRLAFTGRAEDKDAEKRAKEKLDFKIVNDAPRNASLWTIALSGKLPAKPARLFDKTYHTGDFDWSPDSRFIAFSHRPRAGEDSARLADLSEVEVATGTVKELAAEQVAEAEPLYSPDGRWLAFTKKLGARRLDSTRVALLVRATGAVRVLPATADESPSLIGWLPDSRAMLFSEARGTRGAIYRLPVDGPPALVRQETRGTLGAAASLSNSGSHLAFTRETPGEPREAYVWAMAGEPVRISQANVHLALPPLGRTAVVQWKSKDGRAVEGLLTYPVNYTPGQRVPLILNIHGGPAGVFTESFIGAPGLYPVAAFAARGYAVLRANPRGSTGYGVTSRQAVVQDWGGRDFDDLMSGVDHVIGLGVADAEKLAVMGWSYGGYMTAWTVTQTARFKAAAVGAGITNHVSMYGTQDIPSVYEDYFGGPPWEQRAAYLKSSPMEFVQRVKTPTLILHGERDDRVPITQAYEFHRALERQGVKVKMIAYPRQPHGPNEPKFLQHIAEQHLAWVDEHLR
ncbi:MAG: S9 family peptidase [Bryobacterales bacterium]|nr:S9 family peptidase [Bryobacterales bacterium]